MKFSIRDKKREIQVLKDFGLSTEEIEGYFDFYKSGRKKIRIINIGNKDK